MDEYIPTISLQAMLKGKKWGEITRGFLRWVLATYQNDDEAQITTELKALEDQLPEITKLLHTKSLTWLSFFRRLEDASCGALKLGRRTFPTRFIWRDHPFQVARSSLSLSIDESLEPIEGLSNLPNMKAVEASYSFPLRQDAIVQIRVPLDVSAEELARLADFIKLLPHT
jgi:hypothetical protein